MLKAKVLGVGAIVLLVLVSAAFFFIIPRVMSQSSSAMGSAESVDAKSNWKNANPFSLSNYMQRENDLMLILRNESSETLIIEKVCVSETECDSRIDKVMANGTVVRLIEVNKECFVGDEFSYDSEGIFFEYTKNDENHVQIAKNALVGACS